MTSSQKIVKFVAIFLAIFLGLGIMYTIFSFFFSIITNIGFYKEEEEPTSDITKVYETIPAYLDIDLNYTTLIIEQGDVLSTKTNNKNIKVSEENNHLIIKEDKNRKFNKTKPKEIVLSLPTNIDFTKVYIDSGAGEVIINGIKTDSLNLNLGAGKTSIKNTTASRANVDTGAGEVTFENSYLNNLDLDLGIGEIKIDGSITGNSKIDSGIGEVKLSLSLSEEDYTFEFSKGLGEIKLNNQTISNDITLGNGSNYLKINGGIGSVKIDTKGDR